MLIRVNLVPRVSASKLVSRFKNFSVRQCSCERAGLRQCIFSDMAGYLCYPFWRLRCRARSRLSTTVENSAQVLNESLMRAFLQSIPGPFHSPFKFSPGYMGSEPRPAALSPIFTKSAFLHIFWPLSDKVSSFSKE